MPAPRVRNLETAYKIVELRREEYKKNVADLASRLWNGKLSIAQWRAEMQQEIKDLHVMSLIISRGGDPKAVTFSDWGRLGASIKQQYGYLDRYQKQLETSAMQSLLGLVNFKSEKYIANRSGTYGTNARATFWRGVTYGLLPQVPGDGQTRCLCITTPEKRILTKRGWVPMLDVHVGDLVWTHRERWRPVTGVVIKPSVEGQSLMWLNGPTGDWVGCNGAHLWYSSHGWDTALGVKYERDCLALALEKEYVKKDLSEVRSASRIYRAYTAMQSVSVGMSLRKLEGLSGERMRRMRQEPEGGKAMEGSGCTQSDDQIYTKSGAEQEDQVRGLGSCVLANQSRRENVYALLARGEGQKEGDLPIPVGLDQGEWPNPERICDTSCQRGSFGRQVREFDHDDESCPCETARGSGQEQCSVVDVPDVPCEVSAVPEISEWGAEILLGGMLSEGSALYDITVEEDHSFIIEGLVSHNTNCGCHLRIEEGAMPGQMAVYWVMNSALENCPDCQNLAATWTPFIVELPDDMIEAGDALGLNLIETMNRVLVADRLAMRLAFHHAHHDAVSHGEPHEHAVPA